MNTTGSAMSSDTIPGFETFCHLVVEDYLRKKQMHNTLRQFKEEWSETRPSEDQAMLSWYDISMKLRLPDIIDINGDNPNSSVVENISLALMREASLRARMSIGVVAQGLATLPKVKPLPPVLGGGNGDGKITTSNTSVYDSDNDSYSEAPLGTKTGGLDTLMSTSVTSKSAASSGGLHQKTAMTPAVLAAMQQKKDKQEAKAKLLAETNGKPKFVSRAGQHVTLSSEAELIVQQELEKQIELQKKLNARKLKPSNENWIPDLERSRALERDFKVLKDNITDVQKREMQEKREMKQFLVSDLEKARNAESLGQTHRHSCGCCLQKYLLLNLPLRVSQKAVLDIRIKWGGKLTSKTVFGGVNPPVGQYLAGTEVDMDGTILNPTGTFAATVKPEDIENTIINPPVRNPEKMTYLDKIQERLSRMPRCYADVPICTFCSQFFQNQETYRPSFAAITYTERKTKHIARVGKEKEYWDPLKLVEKDREQAIVDEEEEAEQQRLEAMAASASSADANPS